MIFNGRNNQTIEIKIKAIHSGELLMTELIVQSKRKTWKTELPLITVTEALNLFSWLKKFARKTRYYKARLAFEKRGILFTAFVSRKKGKTFGIRLSGACKPAFEKKETYILSGKVSDTAIKKMAFELQEEIRHYAKPSFEERTGLTKDEINNLAFTDTEKYAAGPKNKSKSGAPKLAPFTGISVIVEINHAGNDGLAVDPQEAFWYPFRLSDSKRTRTGNILNTPPAEHYEAALKNNFAKLLVNNLIEHFRKPFFEFDALCKTGKPQYQPGRVDDLFILYYETEDLYKEAADKFVNSVYVYASDVRIAYGPMTVRFDMSSYNSLFLLFDYRRDKLMHFMKKYIPEVFLASIREINNLHGYDDVKVSFSYMLLTQHGKALAKKLN
jgi:hypothetical protein